MASLLKRGEENIIRPSWLIDCVKQNEKDAGMPDFLLPFEPRYVSMARNASRKLISMALIGTCFS